MADIYKDIDEVIARQLTGEQSTEDEMLISQWLATDEANVQYYTQLQRLWNVAPSLQPPLGQSIDTEAALRKVKMVSPRLRPSLLRSDCHCGMLWLLRLLYAC